MGFLNAKLAGFFKYLGFLNKTLEYWTSAALWSNILSPHQNFSLVTKIGLLFQTNKHYIWSIGAISEGYNWPCL